MSICFQWLIMEFWRRVPVFSLKVNMDLMEVNQQKSMFVHKQGEGAKNTKKLVEIIYGCPSAVFSRSLFHGLVIPTWCTGGKSCRFDLSLNVAWFRPVPFHDIMLFCCPLSFHGWLCQHRQKIFRLRWGNPPWKERATHNEKS